MLSKKARAAAQFQINANLPLRAKVAKLSFSILFQVSPVSDRCASREKQCNTKLLPDSHCMKKITKKTETPCPKRGQQNYETCWSATKRATSETFTAPQGALHKGADHGNKITTEKMLPQQKRRAHHCHQ